MGELTDKIVGQAKQVAGKLQRGVGEATDRPDIKADGAATEAEGTLQEARGKAKGVVNRALGE